MMREKENPLSNFSTLQWCMKFLVKQKKSNHDQRNSIQNINKQLHLFELAMYLKSYQKRMNEILQHIANACCVAL